MSRIYRIAISFLAIISVSPATHADRHCSQGLGWMTIVLTRIASADEAGQCNAQRQDLLEWVEAIQDDFAACGCLDSRRQLETIQWQETSNSEACTEARSNFAEQVSRIRTQANEECGH